MWNYMRLLHISLHYYVNTQFEKAKVSAKQKIYIFE